jgi:Domain of unknown function (DUF4440)
MTEQPLIEEFQLIDDNFNQVLTSNNVDEISKLLSDDWILLEPQFGLITKERFLKAIDLGELSHKNMIKKVLRVKLHNDIAIVTTRGMNIGQYNGRPFNSEQWVTSIYKREKGNWICTMIQEMPVACRIKAI